jgi:hypothetical protein
VRKENRVVAMKLKCKRRQIAEKQERVKTVVRLTSGIHFLAR